MIFLKRELPGQPPKRQTGIEKIGKNRTKLSGKTGRNFQAKGRRKGLHSESCTVRGIRFNRTKDRKGRLNAVIGVGRPFYFLRLVEIT